MSKRSIIAFLATLVLATWILQWAGFRAAGGDLESEAITPWLIAAMFMPTIWSLGFIAFSREARRSVAWRPGRLSALVLAPLIPAAVAFALLKTFWRPEA